MKLSNISATYLRRSKQRVHQGDILRDISIQLSFEKNKGQILVKRRDLSYAVVISQDCDIESHFRDKKKAILNPDAVLDALLPSIIILPAYPADQFREGTHFEDGSVKMFRHNSDQWSLIKINGNKRFHYLPKDQDKQVPSLVVDFKHIYTVPVDSFARYFKESYLISLNELFREDLSQRYANYLSRIGMPDFSLANASQSTSTSATPSMTDRSSS